MRIVSALTIALFPVAGLAQSASGTISGTFDRNETEWSVTEAEGVPSSTWRETEDGIAVEIYGYPELDPDSPNDAFVLTFTLPKNATDGTPDDLSAELRRADGPTVTASGENLNLQLTTATQRGDSLSVSGDLTATFTEGETDQLVVDPDGNAATFDGSVQATIIRAD